MRIIKVERFADEYKICEYKQHNGAVKKSAVELPPDIDGRYQNNISRARSRVFELARCNEWEYFCTLTLSSEYDRTDLSEWKKKFSQWIRDYRKKGHNVKYLLVPELHKNGGWHMHGFFSGIGSAEPFAPEDIGGTETAAAVREYKANELNEAGYLQWRDYSKKWGYCTLAPVRNIEAASRYVTKYITKDIGLDNLASGAHLFYASQGLNGAEVVAWNAIPENDRNFFDGLETAKQFSNEYVNIWWTKKPEQIGRLCNIITGQIFEFTETGKSTGNFDGLQSRQTQEE